MRHLITSARLAPARMAFNTRGIASTPPPRSRASDKEEDRTIERGGSERGQPGLGSASSAQSDSLSAREREAKSFETAERNAERDAGKNAGKMNSATVDQAVRDDAK